MEISLALAARRQFLGGRAQGDVAPAALAAPPGHRDAGGQVVLQRGRGFTPMPARARGVLFEARVDRG